MKKEILIIVVLCIILTSCEKDYSCTCKEVDTSTGKTTKTWNTMKGSFIKQSDAETWCHGNETSGFGMRIECTLK